MPLALALVLLAGTAAAAVVPAPGYLARTLATPDVVQGGVVRHAGAVLVGQGSFGPASEYVVRLDSAGSTVVATGFNSLGGIDVAPNGELFVVDNGGELPGAVTGDTLFEFPDALTRQTSLAAAGHEVLPPGTLPAAQDVLLVPETLLVTEATGPGAGRVLRVSEQGLPSPFVGGLDYASGLAFGSTGAVYVAELDASFVGRVRVFDYVTGELRREVASGLSGAFAVALDADGETVLVSGGVA
ncbi:MAG TPA: hypothetical protein VKA21_03660, partial [Candidatus Binatia bacterium]|nr:hypothetical protein [Candidatus Binatia bacterium]